MRLFKWLLVVGACAAVAVGLGVFKYGQIQAGIRLGKSFPEPREAVEIFTVRGALQQQVTSVTAEVVATRSVDLRNERSGRISRVGFKPGALVEAGQVLLQLDSSEERAQLAAQRAEEQIARLALSRNERLVKSGAGSVEARDQARAQFDAAAASVAALQATIDKKTLRAPFDAVAGLHELEVGQFLDVGTVIVKLVGVSSDIWIDFALPQQQARLAVGNKIAVSVPDLGVTGAPAQIIARDPHVNERSRNLGFRAVIYNAELQLFPGMLVTVEVPLGLTRNVVLVPSTAIRHDALGTSVYVIREVSEGGEKKMRAEKRAVTPGAPFHEPRDLPELDDSEQSGAADAEILLQLVAVTDGLVPGDRIAANGSFKLSDGVLVMPVEPDPGILERVVGK